MKDAIEEDERWDLGAKAASFDENKEDMKMETKKRWGTRFPSRNSYKILRYILIETGRSQDNARKAWWRDGHIYRRKNVPGKIKLRRKSAAFSSLVANVCHGVSRLSHISRLGDKHNDTYVRVQMKRIGVVRQLLL